MTPTTGQMLEISARERAVQTELDMLDDRYRTVVASRRRELLEATLAERDAVAEELARRQAVEAASAPNPATHVAPSPRPSPRSPARSPARPSPRSSPAKNAAEECPEHADSFDRPVRGRTPAVDGPARRAEPDLGGHPNVRRATHLPTPRDRQRRRARHRQRHAVARRRRNGRAERRRRGKIPYVTSSSRRWSASASDTELGQPRGHRAQPGYHRDEGRCRVSHPLGSARRRVRPRTTPRLSPGTCPRRRPSRRRRGAGPRTRRRGDPTGTITIASTTTGHPRRRMRARGVSTRERERRRAGRLRRSPAAERHLAPRPSSRWIRRKTRVRLGTLPRVRGK